jgi:hypothetical protein
MRYMQRALAGAIAAVACGYAVFSLAQSPKEGACGFGPPPSSPDYARFQAHQAAEVERTGYLTVCEEDLARYDITSQLQPQSVAMAELQFQPVALDGTPFNTFTNIGGLQESVSNVNSRLYRSFKMPDGHIVTLFEHDMSADGSQTYRLPKDEPERINDLPARLMVMQARSGKAVSVLSWKEGRRNYEIWMDANVALEKKRSQLFALAASLPKSIPARLHEPESSPPMLGPDGLPILPPSPATIQMRQ